MQPWKRIIVIRHGQSVNTATWIEHLDDPNVKNLMVPPEEDVLSGKGFRSVNSLVESLRTFLVRRPDNKSVPPRIISSPSVRCQQTAEIIANGLGVHGYGIKDELAEMKKWDYQYDRASGDHRQDDRRAHTEEHEATTAWCDTVFGVDSEDTSRVLIVVTHAIAMRRGLHRAMGLPPNVQFGPATASMTVIDYQRTTNLFSIHTMGECCHTGPESLTWRNNDLFKETV